MNIDEHKQTVIDTIKEINKESDAFVLKGGTALLLCYGLDRFSVDIDLDAPGEKNAALRERLYGIVEDLCQKREWAFRVGKDTETVQRFFIHYGKDEGQIEPLKIEVSYRHNRLDDEEIDTIDGIAVYTLDALTQRKAGAYQQRDRVRDLYDLCFICDKEYESLSKESIRAIKRAFEYKVVELLDYLAATQPDPLIDFEVLEERFLRALEKAGLLSGTGALARGQ